MEEPQARQSRKAADKCKESIKATASFLSASEAKLKKLGLEEVRASKRSLDECQAESWESADDLIFSPHYTCIVHADSPASKRAKEEGKWIGARAEELIDLPGVITPDAPEQFTVTAELQDAMSAIFCAKLHAGMKPFEIGAVAGLMMLKEQKVVVNGCEALLPSGEKLEGAKEGCLGMKLMCIK